SLLSALLFSISSNLDNLLVGTAYGIKKIRINFIENIIIALITSTGTFLSMNAGSYMSKFLPGSISNILGALILIILGTYFSVQSIIKSTNNTQSKELALKDIDEMIEYAEKSDFDSSGDISTREALFVAFGLTFNNIGTGIVASITKINIGLTVLFTFTLSILTVKFGESMGTHIIGKFLGKYAPLFSGILLIILGVMEIFN
ncbi:MAG: sporulation membrane protein YtaF, partial [Clostridiales bacterium]|nr:sporulation membrane protein YtaF [Clostridiales bacterium]